MALTAARSKVQFSADAVPARSGRFSVAASTYLYGGSLLFVNSSGYVVGSGPDQTMTCIGFLDGADVDNSEGNAGDETVYASVGVIDLANSSSGDAIAADDVGKLAYAADNETAALTSSSSTRAAIGPIVGMYGSRVLVLAGSPAIRALQTLEAVQPIDADLTALAALSGTGLAARTGSGTWSTRTLTAPVAGISVSNGDGVSGNPTLALADDLAALEALDATAGILAKTAANTYARRTLTAPAAGFSITNPAGTAGDPTFVLANDLAGLEAQAGTGLVTRTGDGTYQQRTLTAASVALSVSNGDGVAGNPTIDDLYAPISVADPGHGQAIPVTRSATINMTTGGSGQTNSLAIPTFVGQRLILCLDTDGGGDRVITVASAINVAGNTIMTFGEARDTIELVGITLGATRAWQVAWNANVALS